eukprot:6502961-Prymnesium_polylepis.1
MGYLCGGPQVYTGRDMAGSHKHLNISDEEWGSFVEGLHEVCVDPNMAWARIWHGASPEYGVGPHPNMAGVRRPGAPQAREGRCHGRRARPSRPSNPAPPFPKAPFSQPISWRVSMAPAGRSAEVP